MPGRTEGGYISESVCEVDMLGIGKCVGYNGKEGKVLHLWSEWELYRGSCGALSFSVITRFSESNMYRKL